MIRFRNPGSNSTTQIAILKGLYERFKFTPFSLEEMAKAMAMNNQMTSCGFAGDEALSRSDNIDASRNATLMNAKMYAEIFKFMGWVGSISETQSYPIVISYIGAHIATTNVPIPLLIESTIEIVTPSDIFSKTTYKENTRVFLSILKMLKDIGPLYKHEICMTAMSSDDSEYEYNQTIIKIQRLRKNLKSAEQFKREFNTFSKKMGMKSTSVDNCTRFPLAKLKDCGLIESSDDEIYGKIYKCVKLTDFGATKLNEYSQIYDLRKSEFENQKPDIQNALIRIGMWNMLSRSGFDISSVNNQLRDDIKLTSNILNGKELLFSPIQTIYYKKVCSALGISLLNVNTPRNIDVTPRIQTVIADTKRSLSLFSTEVTIINSDDTKVLIEKIKTLNSERFNENKILKQLISEHKNDTKDTYYPFISTLFRIIGFDCVCSRGGDNGSRWDAIIKDEKESIPIEIKSPTEEESISVKAIRQALENKIILLSRKTYKTKRGTSSFVVGYKVPNQRSDVDTLISAFKDVFSVRIAVLGLETLLRIVIRIVLNGNGISKNEFRNLEGICNDIQIKD